MLVIGGVVGGVFGERTAHQIWFVENRPRWRCSEFRSLNAEE